MLFFAEDACCPLVEESLHSNASTEAARGRLPLAASDSLPRPQQQSLGVVATLVRMGQELERDK